MFDALKVKNECVEWIKKFFVENFPFTENLKLST